MYSPKIDETMIPRLYRLAKGLNVPMTTLVNDILKEVLSHYSIERKEDRVVIRPKPHELVAEDKS